MAHSSPTVWGYTLGERVWLKVAVSPAGTADIDFTVDDATINLDNEATGERFTFDYRPLGTSGDDNFELEGQDLYFTLTSAWTAENLTEGRWVMSTSVYDPATDQDEIGIVILEFVERPGGVLPTTGG